MNIAATALTLFLDASSAGSSCANPGSGALTNVASTLFGGDGAGSNPASGLAGSIAGLLA